MLLSLQSSIHADILSLGHQFKADLHVLDELVTHLKNKMGEFTSNYNDLVDIHGDPEEDMNRIKAKLADLEDRSRRNNVKIRGIPESIKHAELKEFFTKLMSNILPEAPLSELLIDRIHRLPKFPNLLYNVPRDTIARIHFYHKEKLFGPPEALQHFPINVLAYPFSPTFCNTHNQTLMQPQHYVQLGTAVQTNCH